MTLVRSFHRALSLQAQQSTLVEHFTDTLEAIVNAFPIPTEFYEFFEQYPEYAHIKENIDLPWDLFDYTQGKTNLFITDPNQAHELASEYQRLNAAMNDFYLAHYDINNPSTPSTTLSFLAMIAIVHRNLMALESNTIELANENNDDIILTLTSRSSTLADLEQQSREYAELLSSSSHAEHQAFASVLNDFCLELKAEFYDLGQQLAELSSPSTALANYSNVLSAVRQSIQAGKPNTGLLDGLLKTPECQTLVKSSEVFARQIYDVNQQLQNYYTDFLWNQHRRILLNIPFDEITRLPTQNKALIPNIAEFTRFYNDFSYHIADDILAHDDIEERTLCYERWIMVAKACVEQGNFMGAKNVLSGLNQSGIYRLQLTQHGLSDKAIQVMRELDVLFDTKPSGKHANYQAAFKAHAGNAIPLFNLVLTQCEQAKAELQRRENEVEYADDLERLLAEIEAPDEKFRLYTQIFSPYAQAQQRLLTEQPRDNSDAPLLDRLRANQYTDPNSIDTKLYARSTHLEERDTSTLSTDAKQQRAAKTVKALQSYLYDDAKAQSPLSQIQHLIALLCADHHHPIAFRTNKHNVLSFCKRHPSPHVHASNETLVAHHIINLLSENIEEIAGNKALHIALKEHSWLQGIIAQSPALQAKYDQLHLSIQRLQPLLQTTNSSLKSYSLEHQQQTTAAWVKTAISSLQEDAEDWTHEQNDEYQHNEYHYNDTDLNLLGTNNDFFIREFTKNSYNGPKTEDLLNRAKAFLETAKLRAHDLSHIEDKQAFATWLEAQYNQVAAQILESCTIGTSDNTDEVYSKIKQASDFLRQYLVNLTVATDPALENVEEAPEKAIKAFLEDEAKWLSAQGRPNFIHKYSVDSWFSPDTYQRVSAQEIMGKQINSSVVRDQKSLSNFVKTSCGSIDASGQYHLDFFAYRHSSYPPIKIKGTGKTDTLIERCDGAAKAARQMITTLAEQAYTQDHNPDQPLEIALSSMMLLSPSWLLDGGRENESKQVDESYLATRMLHNRVITVTINTEDGPRDIKVKPNINTMNAPANSKATPLLTYRKDTINQQGIYEFTQNALSAMHNTIAKPSVMPTAQAQASLREIHQLMTNISDFYQYDVGVLKAEQKLATRLASSKLESLYEQLEAVQQRYCDLTDPVNKKAYAREFKRLRHKIKRKERGLKHAYHRVNNARQHVRLTHAAADITRLNAATSALLTDPSLANWFNTDAGRQCRDQLSLSPLFFAATDIYQSQLHLSTEHAHDFQARFVIANYLMGRNVEFFCKSGEDRTGRLNNYIEEFFIHRDKMGVFPGLDQQSINNLNTIAPLVHEFSVSREITHWNAYGARGLQQDSDSSYKRRLRVNAHINVKVDNLLAKLGKSGVLSGFMKKLTRTPTTHYTAQMQATTDPMLALIEHLHGDYTDLKHRIIAGNNHVAVHADKLTTNREQFKRVYERLDKVLNKQQQTPYIESLRNELREDRLSPIYGLLPEKSTIINPRVDSTNADQDYLDALLGDFVPSSNMDMDFIKVNNEIKRDSDINFSADISAVNQIQIMEKKIKSILNPRIQQHLRDDSYSLSVWLTMDIEPEAYSAFNRLRFETADDMRIVAETVLRVDTSMWPFADELEETLTLHNQLVDCIYQINNTQLQEFCFNHADAINTSHLTAEVIAEINAVETPDELRQILSQKILNQAGIAEEIFQAIADEQSSMNASRSSNNMATVQPENSRPQNNPLVADIRKALTEFAQYLPSVKAQADSLQAKPVDSLLRNAQSEKLFHDKLAKTVTVINTMTDLSNYKEAVQQLRSVQQQLLDVHTRLASPTLNQQTLQQIALLLDVDPNSSPLQSTLNNALSAKIAQVSLQLEQSKSFTLANAGVHDSVFKLLQNCYDLLTRDRNKHIEKKRRLPFGRNRSNSDTEALLSDTKKEQLIEKHVQALQSLHAAISSVAIPDSTGNFEKIAEQRANLRVLGDQVTEQIQKLARLREQLDPPAYTGIKPSLAAHAKPVKTIALSISDLPLAAASEGHTQNISRNLDVSKLKDHYRQFLIQASAGEITYTASTNADSGLEKNFVYDAIMTKLSARNRETRNHPMMIGGENTALVNEAKAILKTLSIPCVLLSELSPLELNPEADEAHQLRMESIRANLDSVKSILEENTPTAAPSA